MEGVRRKGKGSKEREKNHCSHNLEQGGCEQELMYLLSPVHPFQSSSFLENLKPCFPLHKF